MAEASLQVYSLNLRRLLAYRSDFWVNSSLSALGHFGVAYFLWKAIYVSRGAAVLSGFTFPEIILYVLLVQLVDRVVRGPEMAFVSQDIYDGGLTRYLVYPLSFFRYKFALFLAESTVAVMQLAIGIGIYLLIMDVPTGMHFSVTGCLFFAVASAAAIAFYFLLVATIEMVAFWQDNVWSLVAMVRMVTYYLGGGLVPLSFYPEWARALLNVTPFPYLLARPVQCLLGEVDFWEWIRGLAILLGWGAVVAVVLARVWARGLKRYSGVGM